MVNLNNPIVFVEDDQDDQYLLAQVVQELAIPNQIRFFHNGQEALHYLKTTQEQPFVILCDINMPLVNGLELRQQIEENPYLKSKSIPFIFFTTGADPDLVKQAYEGTIQGFFQKPSSFEGFKEEIKLIYNYWKRCLHPNCF